MQHTSLVLHLSSTKLTIGTNDFKEIILITQTKIHKFMFLLNFNYNKSCSFKNDHCYTLSTFHALRVWLLDNLNNKL
ncbi:protein of unknown function [Candidatus Nitrotoga arctica]|uniref:Uncharacterized protein n=1 Tax=Candidatus Nitrotoga arctica TaxID=453162 RepID=A0ABN8AMI8_9PROT|nr:protein of unknown function [Candidatus Nitrotoga arctica]